MTRLRILLLLTLAGCASADRPDRFDPQGAADQGARAGASERDAVPGHMLARIPGLEFADVDRRAADDPVAFRALDGVLREARAGARQSAAAEQRSSAAAVDAPREVLAGYIRGREARQEGRYAEAARTLDAARRLAPEEPRILLELGRAVAGLGDAVTAMELFRRVLAINPLEPFAALMVIGDDVQHGRFRDALVRYARLTEDHDRFEHDAAAALIAEDMLRMALLGMGFDRAAIEVTTELLSELAVFDDVTGYRVALGQLMDQRGRIAAEAIDAALRLRDLDSAESFVRAAVSIGDGERHGLGSRVVALRLLRGEGPEVLDDLVEHWSRPEVLLLDRDVRMAAFLREVAGPSPELAEILLSRQIRVPADVRYKQLAAAVSADDDAAEVILRRAAEVAPRNLGILRDRLARAEARGPAAMERLADRLLEETPERARAVIEALFASGRTAAVTADDRASTARSQERLIRLLLRSGDFGSAWRRAEEARVLWPDDEGLLRAAIETAAELDEPVLLLPLLAGLPPSDAPSILQHRGKLWTQVLAAEALVRLGAASAAVERARALRFALERSPQPDRWMLSRVRLLEARAHAEQAVTMDIGPRRSAVFEHASRLASETLSEDPTDREALTFLLALHRSGGPAPDAARIEGLMRGLAGDPRTLPAVAMIIAQDHLQRNRFRSAAHYADFAVSADPHDEEAMAVLIRSLQAIGRSSTVERALRTRLAQRPGDLFALDQLLAHFLREGDEGSARRLLAERLDRDPADRVALSRLEVVARTVGEDEEAMRLGLERLSSLPPGTRRTLQLASLHLQNAEFTKVVRELDALTANHDVPAHHLAMALSLLGQLPRPNEAADRLTVRGAERLLAMPDHAERSDVAAAALASLARLGKPDSTLFESMTQRILDSPVGRDVGTNGALQWRELAQRLVFSGSVPAAARILEARLFSPPEPSAEALGLLASMLLIAEAASDTTGDRLIALADRLQGSGAMPLLPMMEDAADPAEALFIISQICMVIGNLDGAMGVLEQVLTLRPDYGMAKNNLGYMQMERGLPDDQTVSRIESAARAHPDDDNVRDTFAWLRYHQGRFEEAEQVLADLLARSEDGGGSELNDHHGDVLYRLGRREEAVGRWRHAIERLDAEFGRRAPALEEIRSMQVRGFGLLVVEPERLYDERFTVPRRRLMEKISAVEEGREPAVAPTFRELGITWAEGQALRHD